MKKDYTASSTTLGFGKGGIPYSENLKKWLHSITWTKDVGQDWKEESVLERLIFFKEILLLWLNTNDIFNNFR